MSLRNLVFAAVFSAGALGFTQVAQASGSEAEHQQPAGSMTMERHTNIPKENIRQAELTVQKVDAKKHEVTFKAKVTPEANLMENGQPIQLDQLREGDQVRAAFDPATGEVIKLEVIRAQPKHEKK